MVEEEEDEAEESERRDIGEEGEEQTDELEQAFREMSTVKTTTTVPGATTGNLNKRLLRLSQSDRKILQSSRKSTEQKKVTFNLPRPSVKGLTPAPRPVAATRTARTRTATMSRPVRRTAAPVRPITRTTTAMKVPKLAKSSLAPSAVPVTDSGLRAKVYKLPFVLDNLGQYVATVPDDINSGDVVSVELSTGTTYYVYIDNDGNREYITTDGAMLPAEAFAFILRYGLQYYDGLGFTYIELPKGAMYKLPGFSQYRPTSRMAISLYYDTDSDLLVKVNGEEYNLGKTPIVSLK
jgi:hypothetical protein